MSQEELHEGHLFQCRFSSHDEIGGDASASEREKSWSTYIVEPVTMPSTANTKRDGLVEPVTMPSAANTKRADNTTGAAYIDVRADWFGGNTSPSERD